MFIPKAFASAEAWEQVLSRHAFGVLVSIRGDEWWTTHLPYLVQAGGRRVMLHMARANLHWQALQEQPRCRLVVSGAHGYVSPAWYETSEAVPTWNYEAVHVEGVAEVFTGEAELWETVVAMAEHFEEPGAAWAAEQLPDAFRRPLLRSIVGVTIRVEHAEAKQKLSQNRSLGERRRVAREVRARGNAELADAMEALLPPLHDER